MRVSFGAGLRTLSKEFPEIAFAVENMYPVRVRGREFVPYLPGWDPDARPATTRTRWTCRTAPPSRTDALAMADAMGAGLAHVHLGDGTGEGRDEHLVPGRGTQPCAELLASLAARGFTGSVAVEVATRRARVPTGSAGGPRGSLAFARAHLEHPGAGYPLGVRGQDHSCQSAGTNGCGLFDHGLLPGPVRGDVRPGGAPLGAEPTAAVRRRVEVDVAAALVGADAEPGAAVLAQPHRQAPDRAGHVLRSDRRAAAGDVHVPVVAVVAGDPRLDRMCLEQGVERRHGGLVVRPAEPCSNTSRSRLAPRRRMVTSRSVTSAACQLSDAEERPRLLQRLDLGVHKIDRRSRVLVEVHASNLVGTRVSSESQEAGVLRPTNVAVLSRTTTHRGAVVWTDERSDEGAERGGKAAGQRAPVHARA